MGTGTQIPYVTASWNPIVGCTEASEGCRWCWDRRTGARWAEKGKTNE